MRRSATEMVLLDSKIEPLYLQGHGCRVIAKILSEHPALVFKRVRSMVVYVRESPTPKVKWTCSLYLLEKALAI